MTSPVESRGRRFTSGGESAWTKTDLGEVKKGSWFLF